jgi:hypothetical protein
MEIQQLKRAAKWGFALFWFIISLNPLYSQMRQSHSIALGFLQLKDGFNLGMVFNGANLEYRHVGFSPVIQYQYQWENRRINMGIKNSLFGFTSKTQESDPYWQDALSAKNFFIRPHQYMQFGSFNNYNHTNIYFEFIPNISKKHSFAYELDYFTAYYGVRFERLNHSLLWRMTL